MSIKAVRSVLEQSRATEGARLLLVVLAEHLNEQTKRCDPSVRTLARECNTTTRSIRRQIMALEALGELAINHGGGRHHCNRYRITLPKNDDASVTLSNGETLTPASGNGDASVSRTRITKKKAAAAKAALPSCLQ